jgi:hypothetical protein
MEGNRMEQAGRVYYYGICQCEMCHGEGMFKSIWQVEEVALWAWECSTMTNDDWIKDGVK